MASYSRSPVPEVGVSDRVLDVCLRESHKQLTYFLQVTCGDNTACVTRSRTCFRVDGSGN